MTYVSHKWTPDSPQAAPISKLQRQLASLPHHSGSVKRNTSASFSTSRAVGLAIVLRHFGFHVGGPEIADRALPNIPKGENTKATRIDIWRDRKTVVA